eukprot:m.65214 g.65214  ORF g.65214 m.65214 type:complete len:477 (-) comp8274_c0_seq2:1289-2719(-)
MDQYPPSTPSKTKARGGASFFFPGVRGRPAVHPQHHRHYGTSHTTRLSIAVAGAIVVLLLWMLIQLQLQSGGQPSLWNMRPTGSEHPGEDMHGAGTNNEGGTLTGDTVKSHPDAAVEPDDGGPEHNAAVAIDAVDDAALAVDASNAGWWHRGRSGPDPPLHHAAPQRLVAIGDVHGDVSALLRALRLAGAVDARGRWVGKDMTIVQMGDNLDRGTEELAVLHALQRLKIEAQAVGGTVHAMIGNHEMQNVAGDFSSVSGSFGFDTLVRAHTPNVSDARELLRQRERTGLERGPEDPGGYAKLSARQAALTPGGALAAGILSERNVASLFGRTLFVHGGLAPSRVDQLERANQLTRQWMRGNTTENAIAELFPLLFARDSVLWVRDYSGEYVASERCKELHRSLREVGADRMVVGHTPQSDGITSACEGAVWRIDTGMSAWFTPFTSREIQVLEIINGSAVRVIKERDAATNPDKPS